jgi:hypothetical protein
MVPLLFKEGPVRAAYSRTMEVLNDPALGSADEKVADGAAIRLNAAKKDLLREIGEAVGMALPANELERMGYAPRYWQKAQNEQDNLRTLLIDWLEGNRVTHMVAGIFELPDHLNSGPAAPPSPTAQMGTTPETASSLSDEQRTGKQVKQTRAKKDASPFLSCSAVAPSISR